MTTLYNLNNILYSYATEFIKLKCVKIMHCHFFFSKATVSPYWLFEYHFFPSHYSVILATHEN